MKRFRLLLIVFVLLFLQSIIYSQSGELSHIRKRIMVSEGSGSYIDEIEYYDGLGRPVQSVFKSASPDGKDIVVFREYDA
jgi:hypothetical protein